MNRKIKRVAMLLALITMFTMMPVGAMGAMNSEAESGGEQEQATYSNIVPLSRNFNVGDATSLATALTNAASGDTITLVASFTRTTGIVINDGRRITLVTNGHTLDVVVTTTGSTGLNISGGSALLLNNTRGGAFNVSGRNTGIRAANGTAQATSATINNNNASSIGAYASAGGTIHVTGNVIGGNRGVYATGEGAIINVGGNVTSFGALLSAVDSRNGGRITIGGNVVSGGSRGIWATGSFVSVGGSVTCANDGVYASDNSEVIV